MKKKALILPLLICGILSSCNDKNNEESIYTNSPLIISEFIVEYDVNNRAVEIANISDGNVSLSSYSLGIYEGRSKEVTYSISLSGELQPNQTFVIVYSGACQTLLDKANLVSEDFINPGSWAMCLFKNNKPQDVLGKIGFTYKYANEKDLVRKKEHFKSLLEFDSYNFVTYPNNQYDHLGNLDVISEEELFAGPKLTEEFIIAPFCKNETFGGGGLIQSKLIRTVDGDTSYFDYGKTWSSYGISGSLSTRYYGINTPEIAHRAGESSDPYGDEAKMYTNSLLSKSKKILIQSVKNYSLHETYGRMLCFIWISDLDNPTYADYQLLNFLIIKEGFSNVAFTDSNQFENDMMYMGLSYIGFLRCAQEYATYNKLNIHSEE